MDRFERITDEHPVDAFRCGNAGLDDWLVDTALNSDRSGTARVYVWLDEIGEVNGYFAIAPHTVRREGLPHSVARGSPDVIPERLLALQEEMSEGVRERLPRGRLAVDVIDGIIEFPVVTVADVERRYGTSNQAARNAAKRLVDERFLEPLDEAVYGRRFWSPRVFQVIGLS